jgi:type II secretion system protein H
MRNKAPNPKLQAPEKHQSPNRKTDRRTGLEVEVWNFPGAWSLELGAYSGAGAFTLIELILVMAILTIAVSITAPSLANFFHGRALDSEARRLLALTRQGQTRAVAEGLPVDLWVDAQHRAFGLEIEPSFNPKDSKAVDFMLDGNVQIEVVNLNSPNTALALGISAADSSPSTPPVFSNHPGLPRIRFQPDGSVDSDSPTALHLMDADGVSLWLAKSRSGLNYEIRTSQN